MQYGYYNIAARPLQYFDSDAIRLATVMNRTLNVSNDQEMMQPEKAYSKN